MLYFDDFEVEGNPAGIPLIIVLQFYNEIQENFVCCVEHSTVAVVEWDSSLPPNQILTLFSFGNSFENLSIRQLDAFYCQELKYFYIF